MRQRFFNEISCQKINNVTVIDTYYFVTATVLGTLFVFLS